MNLEFSKNATSHLRELGRSGAAVTARVEALGNKGRKIRKSFQLLASMARPCRVPARLDESCRILDCLKGVLI
ncbi:MAG: hypothetical protein JXK94_02095 [Deltaproteobacteria bacterium]|nr:hypothetical protein [Deltaproteobacteria bacterium]